MFSVLDYIIFGVVGLTFIFGIIKGFGKQVTSIVCWAGIFAGLIFAGVFLLDFVFGIDFITDTLTKIFFRGEYTEGDIVEIDAAAGLAHTAMISVVILAAMWIAKVITLLFPVFLINKAFKRKPKFLSRLLGGILGIAKSAIHLVSIYYLLNILEPFNIEILAEWVDGSWIWENVYNMEFIVKLLNMPFGDGGEYTAKIAASIDKAVKEALEKAEGAMAVLASVFSAR